MRLILAGNHQQYLAVARPGDKYLAVLPDDLFGHHNCDLIEVGTFFEKADFEPAEIYYYCKSHNISMSGIMQTLVKAETK